MYERLASYYDLTHDALVEDVALILELAAQVEGPVLELGCGTGRLLRPLSRANHQVTGVDNSLAMLTLAQHYLSQEPAAVQQRVQLVEQDFTLLQLPGTTSYGLAIMPYNTFLHLDSRAKLAVLKRVRRYLGENGRFFIDLINPFTLASLAPENDFVLENELIDPETESVIEQWSKTAVVDDEAQMVQIDWLYKELGEGGEETAVSLEYYYAYPHELELMLKQAGFQLQALWGDYDQVPFSQENPRLLLLAETIS
ncbi:MAG: class I SAM-dependent methyltransferase [Chloroflexota bacterium]